ncbi:hypothetical protein H5968_21605 [Sphaerospermopsis sp. LEGE 00249]|nr:hypothetical protein [Sphaerospermopsis sp. LEGE 00249]MBC5797674.1 hypothetical protein [Sphaerospermopsis sp. LEGE 00249]
MIGNGILLQESGVQEAEEAGGRRQKAEGKYFSPVTSHQSPVTSCMNYEL